MLNKEKNVEPTSESGNDAKPIVSRSRIVAELDWFDPIDFADANIQKLTKAELLELLQMLNKQMIDSLENWDGG